MKNRIIFLTILVTLLAIEQIDAQDKVGTAAAQFLQIPVGSKAIAMGGAFTAISDDPTALYWNPGALSRSVKSRVYASQTSWLVDSKHQWLGAQIKVTNADAIGLCFNSLDYGAREKVTTVAQPEGTGEFWEASDMAFSLTYARNLTDRFSIGGTVKYIQEKIWHESASQFALDLGLLFVTQFNGLTIGATMRNFGGELIMEGRDLLNRIDLDPDAEGNNETIVAKLKTDNWPIPLTFSVGAAMPLFTAKSLKVMVAADVVRPTDNSQTMNVGAEAQVMRILSIRGGYQTLFRTEREQGLTLGMGLNVPIPYADIVIDFAYQEFGLFGNVQTTAISIGF